MCSGIAPSSKRWDCEDNRFCPEYAVLPGQMFWLTASSISEPIAFLAMEGAATGLLTGRREMVARELSQHFIIRNL